MPLFPCLLRPLEASGLGSQEACLPLTQQMLDAADTRAASWTAAAHIAADQWGQCCSQTGYGLVRALQQAAAQIQPGCLPECTTHLLVHSPRLLLCGDLKEWALRRLECQSCC